MQIDYVKIVINGIVHNYQYLDNYFKREMLKAENEHYSKEEFLNGCSNIVDLLEKEIDNQFYEMQRDLCQSIEFTKNKNESEFPELDQNQKVLFKNKEDNIKFLEDAIKGLNRNMYNVNLIYFANLNIPRRLSYSEIVNLRDVIKLNYLEDILENFKKVYFLYKMNDEENINQYDIVLVQNNYSKFEQYKLHSSIDKFNIILAGEIIKIIFRSTDLLFNVAECLDYHSQKSTLEEKEFKQFIKRFYFENHPNLKETRPLIHEEFIKWIDKDVSSNKIRKTTALSAPIIRRFCELCNNSGLDPRGIEENAIDYCQRICERFNLPYSDNVRQYFTPNNKPNSTDKNLKKVIELIIPQLKEEERAVIDSYIKPK